MEFVCVKTTHDHTNYFNFKNFGCYLSLDSEVVELVDSAILRIKG